MLYQQPPLCAFFLAGHLALPDAAPTIRGNDNL